MYKPKLISYETCETDLSWPLCNFRGMGEGVGVNVTLVR